MADPAPTTCLVETDFDAPIDDRYLEDYAPGAVYEYGYLTVTEDEILQFARKFDPQYFHVDPQRAERSPFGGIIASGWHTCAMCMRLFVDHYISHVASMTSPGVDEVRWPRPVRPGDTLRLRATVDEARPSRSKPDRGILNTTLELLNQEDDVVMSCAAMNMMLRRHAEEETRV